ncbi:MAG: GNAT family N-acetyltransferase [Candidatus Zixiibacteriota bacterium]
MLVFTSDKERLLRHFRKDPVLFAYHIGDLDDFYFPDTQWAVIYNVTAKVEDVVLTYYGGKIPTILAFGLTERFEQLLDELLEISPRQFYVHYQQRSHASLARRYTITPLGTHWKMHLKNPPQAVGYPLERFAQQAVRHPEELGVDVRQLDSSHEPELLSLYNRSYPGNYFRPRMLQSGKYFGAFDGDRLAAVAGVHVDSAEYKTAALGNIVTDEEYRRRGLASIVTGHLCEELISEGKLVSLNVKADNHPAIRCYEKLGFVKTHEFEEALCELV